MSALDEIDYYAHENPTDGDYTDFFYDQQVPRDTYTMQITGTITKATAPGDPYGQYSVRYAFSGLMDAQGVEHNLVWVNRDPRPIENQRVTISDTSKEQNKIKYEQDKKGNMRYRIMGTGVSIINAQGIDLAAQTTPQPAQGAQGAVPPHLQGQQGQGQPQGAHGHAAAQQQSMKDLVDYGLDCVRYAREQGEGDGAVLASIFGSAMYGLKEGRPLGLPARDLTASAKQTFNVTSDPSEEDDDTIPF